MIARILTCFTLTASVALALDSPQFRGPQRNGVFAAADLLQVWPEGGPKELWSTEGLGEGYASVAVVDGRIYTSGSPNQTAYVFAFDTQGGNLWKTELGPEHAGGGYPGSRSTPTVDGKLLYVLSGNGTLACLRAEDGSTAWQVDAKKQLGARQDNSYFGMAESILIDGDKAIFTPGGSDGTLVALNKTNGEVIWKSQGTDQSASFCSARIFQQGDTRQIITMTASAMIGVNPNNGKVLWQQEYPAQYSIHAVSPVFHERLIYVSDGYNQGGSAFSIAANGQSVTQKWQEKSLDIHHGGAISLNGFIYGTSSKGHLICLDFETGQVQSTISDVEKGSIIYADGRLYCYGEKGSFSLVDPNPTAMKVVSRFQVEKGSSHHWAHPVIVDGRLYVRHGDALMAYHIAR